MIKHKPTTLTIILVSYNGRYWLKKTLESLKEQYLDHTTTHVRVVVVDNGSADETPTMLRRSFRWVELIALPTNVGFAAANNQALKTVSTDYVMLLNSDTELTSESNIDTLLEYLRQNPQVGMVSPRVELLQGSLDLASHRGEPTIWAAFTYFSGLEKLFPRTKIFGSYHQLYKDMESAHEVDACSGAAMIVRNAALTKVGLLDERFFMYAEDLDWCRRFREAGWKIVYFPQVKIIHHKYKSGISSLSQQTAARTHHLFFDTMMQYYDKYYQTTYPKWVRSLIYLVIQLKKGAV